ncbi:PepSY domain-containing protein [Halorussus sp. AFM4]|uniref:PepSY domain-containing protein n=1 Tax=Halorussus sp. AFM4 TaxID=3421651 RepID=UPI003EBF0D4A
MFGNSWLVGVGLGFGVAGAYAGILGDYVWTTLGRRRVVPAGRLGRGGDRHDARAGEATMYERGSAERVRARSEAARPPLLCRSPGHYRQSRPVNGMTRNRLFGLGLVLLLVVGPPVAAATPAVASTATGEISARPASATDAARNATAVDAMVAAQNATNGTAIGVERERNDGTPVWEVEVLRADGARFEVDVHVATGAVRRVEDGSVLGGGASEALLPVNRTRNVSAMRSAVEAVEAVRNESVTASSVTQVSLEVENSTLVYEIEYATRQGDGEVHVAALRDRAVNRTTGRSVRERPGVAGRG